MGKAAGLLEIEDLLDRKPSQLSGGQAQRTAIGRAIVREPDVFLMDEPLANLDARLRLHMRGELTKLQRKLDAKFTLLLDKRGYIQSAEKSKSTRREELWKLQTKIDEFVNGLIALRARKQVADHIVNCYRLLKHNRQY